MTFTDPQQYTLALREWTVRKSVFDAAEAQKQVEAIEQHLKGRSDLIGFLRALFLLWMFCACLAGIHFGPHVGWMIFIIGLFFYLITGKAGERYLERRYQPVLSIFAEPEPLLVKETPPRLPPPQEPQKTTTAFTDDAPSIAQPYIPKATWDTLIISDSLREKLQTYCEILRYAEAFRERGVTTPKGLLFHGPPGTGKTETARVLAGESGFNFVGCTTADIKKGWLGHSGQAVKLMFATARQNAPTLLFIDELEAITNDVNSSPDTITAELTAQLLQEIDGIYSDKAVVFVIGATNQPDRINRALMSRFTEKIAYLLPSFAERIQILYMLTDRLPLTVVPEFLALLAARCEGTSGRDLRTMVERATIRSISRARDQGNSLAFALVEQDFIPDDV